VSVKVQKDKGPKKLKWDTEAGTIRALRKAHDNIQQKCLNAKDPQYKNYGQRGISFHPDWASDRAQFVKEVIAEIGLKSCRWESLDRKNNDGNYEPGNLRWASKQEQAINRRSSALVTIGGAMTPRAEIARASGVSADTMAKRARRAVTENRVANIENYWLEQLKQTNREAIKFDPKQRRIVSGLVSRIPSHINLAPILWYVVRFWKEFAADATDGVRKPPSEPNVEFLATHIAAALKFANEKHGELRARSVAYQQAQWEAEVDEAEQIEDAIAAREPGPLSAQDPTISRHRIAPGGPDQCQSPIESPAR
jgi:hypothetical protein